MQESQPSVVDRLYSDFKLIIEQIDLSEISLRNSAEEIFQKSLCVAIGSYFERRIAAIVLEFVGRSSVYSVLVTEFVRNKAISRQYHTYFQWNSANANKFFSLFGAEFRAYMSEYVSENPEYGDAIKAFMQVGGIRNEVAHNFEYVSIDATADEIYELYRKALLFVDQIPLRFDEFAQRQRQD